MNRPERGEADWLGEVKSLEKKFKSLRSQPAKQLKKGPYPQALDFYCY